jgi:hypothetical protein
MKEPEDRIGQILRVITSDEGGAGPSTEEMIRTTIPTKVHPEEEETPTTGVDVVDTEDLGEDHHHHPIHQAGDHQISRLPDTSPVKPQETAPTNFTDTPPILSTATEPR